MLLDDEAKAELLCFLVVGHLVAIARTGDQLRTDHLVEASHLWLKSNGGNCTWVERATIIEASRQVARLAQCKLYPNDESNLIKLFNLDAGWFLDYRSPIVREIHAMAIEHLKL